MNEGSAGRARPWTHCQSELLALIEQERFGLISDFDGTLSPFAQLPTDAAIAPEIAALLDQLRERVTVIALVSGRGVRDLRSRFERPNLVYYGNHGMEVWRANRAQFVEAAQAWMTPLHDLLAQIKPKIALDGVILEDKGVTASIHYRLAPNPSETRHVLRAFLSPVCHRYGFRLTEGQYIWEIKPPIHLDKGTALHTIVEDYRLSAALFMGDDVTDFSAMDKLRELASDSRRSVRGLSVGVAHPTTHAELFTRADLLANGVDDVTRLLRWLLDQRMSRDT